MGHLLTEIWAHGGFLRFADAIRRQFISAKSRKLEGEFSEGGREQLLEMREKRRLHRLQHSSSRDKAANCFRERQIDAAGRSLLLRFVHEGKSIYRAGFRLIDFGDDVTATKNKVNSTLCNRNNSSLVSLTEFPRAFYYVPEFKYSQRVNTLRNAKIDRAKRNPLFTRAKNKQAINRRHANTPFMRLL